MPKKHRLRWREIRVETLESVEEKPYNRMVSNYESEKANFLYLSADHWLLTNYVDT